MTPRRGWMLAAAWSAALACGEPPQRRAAATSMALAASTAAHGEGGSPVSLDSALTLFRTGLHPLSELENSEPSLDLAVGRLFRSIARSDTAELRAVVMSRREFAWLYYPTSPFTRAPTKQEPGLAWFLHVQNSQKGASRLLSRYGRRPLTLERNECKGPGRIEGLNRIWDDCMQRLAVDGDTVSIRLFGGIYERQGRFKVFSYSNDL
ncbi:MAG: hypothetical protein AABZ80_01050 [Gemmatimonadota bacterium]